MTEPHRLGSGACGRPRLRRGAREVRSVLRRGIRRLTPRALMVALTSVAMVVTAVAVSQADPGPGRPCRSPCCRAATPPPCPPPTWPFPPRRLTPAADAGAPPPPTATTGAGRIHDGRRQPAERPRRHLRLHRPEAAQALPQARLGQPPQGVPAALRPTGLSHPATWRSPPGPLPPAVLRHPPAGRVVPAAPLPAVRHPATGRLPDAALHVYDTDGNARMPRCPAYATADGKPAPCPPPCAYPTEPRAARRSDLQPAHDRLPAAVRDHQLRWRLPPPPCERDASCPPPCYSTQPYPATTTADPVPPSQTCPPPCDPKACPPPCPSAAPTDQRCTPPCSYPGSDGTAGAAFAPCPAPSGVAGRVTAGPTCPVERPDQPCADKPVETTLRLVRKDGSVAATGKSGPDGSFRITAAPGTYELVADWPSRVGGCGPVEVTIERGRWSYADVSCDTGIR